MLGLKIYNIRKKRGFTLSELAERADISKSYLSNIERDLNRNPSIQVLKKITRVLDVDLEELIASEGKIEEEPIPDKEWLDLANQLKESGIEKEQLEDYKTLIQFIKWQKQNKDSEKSH